MDIISLSPETITQLGEIIAQKINRAMSAPEPWVGIDYLAESLQVAKSTIYKWVTMDGFPCKRGRPLLFKRSLVDLWLLKR